MADVRRCVDEQPELAVGGHCDRSLIATRYLLRARGAAVSAVAVPLRYASPSGGPEYLNLHAMTTSRGSIRCRRYAPGGRSRRRVLSDGSVAGLAPKIRGDLGSKRYVLEFGSLPG